MDANQIKMAEWIVLLRKKLQEEKRREIMHSELSSFLGIPAQTIKDWTKRPDYTFGGLHPRNKEKLRKLFPNEFGPPKSAETLPNEQEDFNPFIMPILAADWQRKGLARYTYALEVLRMPLATFQKWTKRNYRFLQLAEKYQRRLSELFPDKFEARAKQGDAPVQLKKAQAMARFNAASAAIIVQYEVSKLIPILEAFVKGTEEDRKALRDLFKDNEWYNFMNLVSALSSEKAREVALQEKRIQFTNLK